MNRKTFYIITSLCATIILVNSLEIFIKAKDVGLFEAWVNKPDLNIDKTQPMGDIYSIYITMCLSTFFMKIITPIALAINTYIALIKTGVTKLFVAIWMVLLVGAFIFTSLGQTGLSVFFIISAISHLILLIVLSTIYKEINNQRIRMIRNRTHEV
ncbi:MAG: hypothetical protein ACRC7N_10245 [Clostridium sp.]